MDGTLDLLDHPIDDRARRAGADLRRAATLRALPDLPDARSMRSTVGRPALLAVAVVGALIVGLVAIGNRQNQIEPSDPTGDIHWVIDGLPQGWAPVGVRGPGTATTSRSAIGTPVLTIFGTSAAPSGPVFETYVYGDERDVQPATAGASNYQEHTVDGVDVVLATAAPTAARLAWAKIEQQWVPMQAAGMSDDELLQAAAHLTVAADGSVQVAAEHLPAGVTALASGPIASVARAWWAGVAMQGTMADTLSIDYRQGAVGGPILSLTVSRPVGGQLAFAALSSSDMEPVEIDGIEVWQMLNEQGLPVQAAWQRDGRFFILGTSQPGEIDLPTVAASVRPATIDEWAALPDGDVDELDQTTGTELPTGTDQAVAGADIDAPGSTDPPAVAVGADEITDISLDWSMTDQRPHEVTLETRLPDGFRSSVSVAVVGGSISMGSDETGWLAFPWADGEATRLEWQGIGALAVTHDDRATQLRVLRANGDRYTVDLVTVSGEPDTKFAIVRLPEYSFVSADLLAADGTVIHHVGV